jgi:hypothetical protein
MSQNKRSKRHVGGFGCFGCFGGLLFGGLLFGCVGVDLLAFMYLSAT